MGKVLVNLEKTKHISIIGDAGSGKTRYVNHLVAETILHNPNLKVVVFGSKDESWEKLADLGLITLYSMEETIKGDLLADDKLIPKEDTLVVIEGIWNIIQMLPRDKHESVVGNIHEILTRPNVHSIVTSFRPISVYYPKIILDLANTKVALKLVNESDYKLFFGTNAYKNNNRTPEKLGEAYIKVGLKHDPHFIENSKYLGLKNR